MTHRYRTIRRLRGLMLALSAVFLAGTAEANPAGYLFATFKNGEEASAEQVYFAVSQDGRSWSQLNDGEPAIVSRTGDRGIRDPFLLRGHDGKTFYLIATDLSMHHTQDWTRAKRQGSRSIIMSTSEDLVHWTEPRAVVVAPPVTGCVWAPEAVYDEQSGDYLVYWASTDATDDYAKFRIWAARTKDFEVFGDPFVFIEKPTTVIDTTIVRDGLRYYRFTKDDKFKAISMEAAPGLMGPWRDVAAFSLAKLTGYEGPQAYMIDEGDADRSPVWTLILDRYSTREGYQPFVSTDLSSGQFVSGVGFSFPFEFRHGSVLALTAEELARLTAPELMKMEVSSSSASK